ncbi:hypothetical protein Ancab_014552 [Ancistrocladus abbreviatus]
METREGDKGRGIRAREGGEAEAWLGMGEVLAMLGRGGGVGKQDGGALKLDIFFKLWDIVGDSFDPMDDVGLLEFANLSLDEPKLVNVICDDGDDIVVGSDPIDDI